MEESSELIILTQNLVYDKDQLFFEGKEMWEVGRWKMEVKSCVGSSKYEVRRSKVPLRTSCFLLPTF